MANGFNREIEPTEIRQENECGGGRVGRPKLMVVVASIRHCGCRSSIVFLSFFPSSFDGATLIQGDPGRTRELGKEKRRKIESRSEKSPFARRRNFIHLFFRLSLSSAVSGGTQTVSHCRKDPTRRKPTALIKIPPCVLLLSILSAKTLPAAAMTSCPTLGGSS